MPQAGGLQRVQPEFAAAARQFIHLARGLADRPDHPEIADGCPLRLRAALKYNYAASAHSQVVSVRQPYYAGADNCVIELSLRHIDVIIVMVRVVCLSAMVLASPRSIAIRYRLDQVTVQVVLPLMNLFPYRINHLCSFRRIFRLHAPIAAVRHLPQACRRANTTSG